MHNIRKTGSTMPGKPSQNEVGRPVDESKLEAFTKLCNFLDNNNYCQYLLQDLMEVFLTFQVPVASKILTYNWYADRKKTPLMIKKRTQLLASSKKISSLRLLDISNLQRKIQRWRKSSRRDCHSSAFWFDETRKTFTLQTEVFLNLSFLRCVQGHLYQLCSEICKYEISVAMKSSSEVQDTGFVQFVFDNADRNTPTVVEHGTFQVIGGVQCVTAS
ncbi:hypothetical protein AVEN_265009-1 [Araneus ventricosus]|uniref:Uncharacterized protein n=1 Tax=Araneus ventricosus TaxID=182803 RepID=A0A4Y2EPX1_ARAVE|nr:hypothetical protein AVEN_265009-1 [Araneus ventricosus]